MKKPSKKRTKQPTIVVIIVLIIAIVTALQQNNQKSSTSGTPTLITQVFMTATTAPNTRIPAATASSSTLVPRPTNKPLATDPPGLEITPINGELYEITGSVDALNCPDSRCKVIETYKKRNIIVVTGTVMGTTYKTKKTRIWYQVLAHDGRKVYVHGSFVVAHDAGIAG